MTQLHPNRDRLALALDMDDLVDATRMARKLQPYFGFVKVGLELFSAAGPEAVGAFRDLGFRVFLDLKLHDIPTTVGKAARVVGALGAELLTVHASGGDAMMRAACEGFLGGAEAAGLALPKVVAVTVLTSDADAPPHVMLRRVTEAVEAGCDGIVCSALDVRDAKQLAPRLYAVVPGTRPDGEPAHDQANVATPAAAIAAGADLLVIGRTVLQSKDPKAMAEAIASSF
jgi:orotidine-5'-phosphate decarboxylase